MQVLRDAEAMEHAIATWPDRAMCDVLASHLAFWREQEEIAELANVILVEPGDTVHQLDTAMNGLLLSTPRAPTNLRHPHSSRRVPQNHPSRRAGRVGRAVRLPPAPRLLRHAVTWTSAGRCVDNAATAPRFAQGD